MMGGGGRDCKVASSSSSAPPRPGKGAVQVELLGDSKGSGR